jgi:hypothetical protein
MGCSSHLGSTAAQYFYGVITLKIAYIRVSTLEQNTARQEIAMSDLGIDRVFIEKVSGKNTERPELKKMLSFVREGDVLYSKAFQGLPEASGIYSVLLNF